MNIGLSLEKLKLSDKYRDRIVNKFTLALTRHLTHLDEDLRKAQVNVSKMARGGYEVKFDMKLPFVHVFAKETGPKLLTTVLKVRDEATRILRKSLDKMRDRKR